MAGQPAAVPPNPAEGDEILIAVWDDGSVTALHAPEVECISKGKARTPYEFGVKVSLAVTHKPGLMVGARSVTGNPYDGHVLSAQLEQTRNLLQDLLAPTEK